MSLSLLIRTKESLAGRHKHQQKHKGPSRQNTYLQIVQLVDFQDIKSCVCGFPAHTRAAHFQCTF